MACIFYQKLCRSSPAAAAIKLLWYTLLNQKELKKKEEISISNISTVSNYHRFLILGINVARFFRPNESFPWWSEIDYHQYQWKRHEMASVDWEELAWSNSNVTRGSEIRNFSPLDDMGLHGNPVKSVRKFAAGQTVRFIFDYGLMHVIKPTEIITW